MVFPFMVSQLIFLPQSISLIAIVGLTLAGVMEIRQGHIGRIGLAINALLLWQIFFGTWMFLPEWFQWYLNIGTIMMFIAVPAYIFGQSLPKEFYQVSFILYGSLSVILAVIIFAFSGVPIRL
ncbi:MAG: hypothetical protein WA139_01845 [Candidatus Aenigmatarchaeota archaeon]